MGVNRTLCAHPNGQGELDQLAGFLVKRTLTVNLVPQLIVGGPNIWIVFAELFIRGWTSRLMILFSFNSRTGWMN